MIAITAQFPLGMYNALGVEVSDDGSERAEWPPSPVRVIGALLAAAHEVPSDDVEADRRVIARLCESEEPPVLVAPPLADEVPSNISAGVHELRGTTRWVPRNPELSELRSEKEGIWPTKLRVKMAAANKSGVAVGDEPVVFVWEGVDLDADEYDRLNRLVSEVAWLGTSRTPTLMRVVSESDAGDVRVDERARVWNPVPWSDPFSGIPVRVPTPELIAQFDRSHAARRSTKDRVEKVGLLAPTNGGAWVNYTSQAEIGQAAGFDAGIWSSTPIVVAVDREHSGLPSLSNAYQLTRSLRRAILATFEARGLAGDAPSILVGRGSDPHVAITPMAHVGYGHSDGAIYGFAIWIPQGTDRTEPDQRERVAGALRQFTNAGDERRSIAIEGNGQLWLGGDETDGESPIAARGSRLQRAALSLDRYTRASEYWLSVTPVVHSRFRTSTGRRGVERQVEADLSDAGLPEYAEFHCRDRCYAWGGSNAISREAIPEEWAASVNGPRGHLALRFDRPVRGPILLGRARHYGVGLCVPVSEDTWREVVSADGVQEGAAR